MAVQETIYPDGNVANGSWTGSYTDIDETGSHDGDTTYRQLQRVDTIGSTVSAFEVTLQDPTKYLANPQVRDAETWKTLLDLKVRDAESWKDVKALSVRDGESWKLLVPRIVVRVTARNNNSGNAAVSFDARLKSGTTEMGSFGSGTVGATYTEFSFAVDATTLIVNNADPTALRVALEGTCDVNEEGAIAELRITQIKVELED